MKKFITIMAVCTPALGVTPPEAQKDNTGLELPVQIPEYQMGHFEVGLWPEDLLFQLEIMDIEDQLLDLDTEGEEEYPGTRESLSNAYETMLCALPKSQWVMPDMWPEPDKEDPLSWHMIADCKKKTMTVMHGGEVVKVYKNLEYSRRGFGTKINSLRTPLGEFTITKEPDHRYGPSMRLSGYQGINRGILIHQDLTRDGGSDGCLHLKTADMNEMFEMVPEGAKLTIKQ